MAGNNPALRLVATGEVVTVAKYRARQLLAAGEAVLAEDGGGVLPDPSLSAAVQRAMAKIPSLRNLANVVILGGTGSDVLTDSGDVDAAWTGADGAPPPPVHVFGRVAIQAHELTVPVNAGDWPPEHGAAIAKIRLAEKIAGAFVEAEDAAIINGDGVDKPQGFLTYPIKPVAEAGDGEIGYVTTGSIGDFDPGAPLDCLNDLIFALDARYRANASFIMSSALMARIRNFQDAEGRMLLDDETGRLLGYPVLISEAMPIMAFNAFAVAFGDLGAAYTIVERPELQVVRDPFSAKPDVVFQATKRVGGSLTNSAAIRLLKFT